MLSAFLLLGVFSASVVLTVTPGLALVMADSSYGYVQQQSLHLLLKYIVISDFKGKRYCLEILNHVTKNYLTPEPGFKL